MGDLPELALDSAPAPLDLDLTYGGAMSYTELNGHRGLGWSSAGVGGFASAEVDGTKIADFNGATQATIEIVVQVEAATSGGSRISHVGNFQETGRLTVRSPQAGTLVFAADNDFLETVSFPGITERTVMHVVYDSEEAVAGDRIRFYMNGTLEQPASESPPLEGEAIDLPVDRFYVLGNRVAGSRSFEGVLYYAALYDAALTLAQVEHNAARLDANDDT